MTTTDASMKVAEAPTGELEEWPPRDGYKEWLDKEGVRVIREYAFPDLNTIELGPWERKGGRGAVINIPYNHVPNDAQVIEISPGGKSEPEHHLYEEQIYVVSGHGTTTLWVEGGDKRTFEWGAGALFAIPLNSWYQHFNTSGSEPARYLTVTNAPPMMRLLADDDVMFNSSIVFKNRLGEGDMYSGDGTLYKKRVWESNFIPNAPDMALYGWKERGAGGINVMLEMAGNNLKSHISEFPVGTYKKAHRHGPGAHLVILSGQGFSQLWTKEDMSDVRKIDWAKNGMVIVPSDACFHQHFNTGTTRARYLALRSGSMGLSTPGAFVNQADVPIQEGGMQLEYSYEDKRVHETFEADLAKNGATCNMKAFIPWCTGEVGPTDERLT